VPQLKSGRPVRLAAGFALCALYAPAQDDQRFAVASIKRSPDNDPGMVVRFLPNGDYSARKVPVIALLTFSVRRASGADCEPTEMGGPL
jgi:hypothetical protein